MQTRLVLASVVVAALAACATTTPTPAPPAATAMPVPGPMPSGRMAVANLAGASGSLVSGKLMLMAMDDGVHITGDVGGLDPNSVHGFHIHETGDCSAADASSAGGHFNPTGSAHGRAESMPHHAGDIDNIVANASGVAHVDAHVMGVSLGTGAGNDIAHRALVVHAAPDDYHSQPSGNSGARIGCGVIAVTP